MMDAYRAPLFLAVLSCTLACNSKTQKQAYEEARPAADALRAKIVAAAAQVEKRPPVPTTSTCKAPKKLTFDPNSDAHDTDYMMLAEAKRGGAKADDKQPDEDLDLHFGTNPLPRVLRGTSTNSIYADYTLTSTADEGFKNMVKRGLAVKNVVLVRERLGTLDYFLVDLTPATPTIVCAGTFTPSSDPKLGDAHTEEWITITKNRRTGKEIKRESKTVTSDPRRDALYKDAIAQLALRMDKELGLTNIE